MDMPKPGKMLLILKQDPDFNSVAFRPDVTAIYVHPDLTIPSTTGATI